MIYEKFFTRLEMLDNLRDTLTNFNIGFYNELAQETFSLDYYYQIDYNLAEEALAEYGTFKAINKVRQYELKNFGETFSNLGNPKVVASKLYYILGEETLQSFYLELSNVYYSVVDCKVNEANNQKLLEVINELIDELE